MVPKEWAVAFVGTLIVETPVYVLWLRRPFGLPGAVAFSLLINMATHPIAWSIVAAAPHPFPYLFFAVECGVTAVEALALAAVSHSRFSRRHVGVAEAVAVALAANGFSAGLGLFL